MRVRRPARQHGARALGVAWLILGLIHTPLPQPDYHNIRHHDAPGEVCEHHDHLLRWHPGAGAADDVAILHWHWSFPTSGRTGMTPAGTGPALHAHVNDWQASLWDDAPQVVPGPSSKGVARRASCLPPISSLALADGRVAVVVARGPRGALALGAPVAPRATRAALLQRWVC